MYFTNALTIATTLFSTSIAIAVPTSKLEPKQATPCSGLEGQAQCCAVDVFGIVDLQCSAPPPDAGGGEDTESLCASIGQEARCCVLNAFGQALLCSSP